MNSNPDENGKWESHARVESTAATVDQVVFGNGEDGGIDEAIEAPVGVNAEFIDADIKPVVIHGKMRKIRYSGTTSVGIVGTRRIEGVNEIVTGWIRSLANGEI